jgi:hypothetical protein
MSKVQGADEGDQGTHLPQPAEVEMSQVRRYQDAETKEKVRFVICSTGLPAKLKLERR